MVCVSFESVNIAGDIFANVSLLGYVANCGDGITCDPSITVETDMNRKAFNYTCTQQQNSCLVSIKCTRCSLPESTEIGKWIVLSNSETAFAYGYTYRVAAMTGNRGTNSSAFGQLYASEEFVFRGLEQPTIALLSIVNTVTRVTVRSENFTGFHVEPISQTQGTQVKSDEFNWKKGLRFKFEFREAPNTLEIIQSEKKNIFRHIIDGLAGIVSIVSSVGLGMRAAEYIGRCISKYRKKRKSQRLDNLKQNLLEHYVQDTKLE